MQVECCNVLETPKAHLGPSWGAFSPPIKQFLEDVSPLLKKRGVNVVFNTDQYTEFRVLAAADVDGLRMCSWIRGSKMWDFITRK